MTNDNNMSVEVTNLGASVVSIKVPDKSGNLVDIALGYDSAYDYYINRTSMGATVARNVNRIFPAEIEIDGTVYDLIKNDGENNLHSGHEGVSFKPFKAKENPEDCSVEFSITIAHLEDGFPGNMDLSVTYRLTNENQLEISYKAVSDKDTIANMTNHSYFNLSGHNSGNILDHIVEIYAPYYMPGTKTSIPTGEILSVTDTPFDFTHPNKIQDALKSSLSHLQSGVGFDNNYILSGTGFRKASSVYSTVTDIIMDTYTTEPCIQFYTGAYLRNDPPGKDGAVYKAFSGLCLETQHAPNTPHMPWLKSVDLKAGDVWQSKTAYKFSVK